jgi:hypothetical protein
LYEEPTHFDFVALAYTLLAQGTPTADRNAQSSASDLNYLQQQLSFLREPIWGERDMFKVLQPPNAD